MSYSLLYLCFRFNRNSAMQPTFFDQTYMRTAQNRPPILQISMPRIIPLCWLPCYVGFKNIADKVFKVLV